jgi:serine/threonine protein phosphatase PrpC
MEVCATSEKGLRPKQEDRIFNYRNKKGNIRVFGCFDGHGPSGGGGAVISEALVQAFMKVCQKLHAEDFENPVVFRRFIRVNFLEIDKWIISQFGDVAIESGSTATLGFYEKQSNTYYAVNLGDSRTIYFERDPKNPLKTKTGTFKTTLDHKPSDLKEIDRIERAGGTVRTSKDSSNVARVDGVLALSRAFGDFQLKKPFNAAKSNWVSNIPNIYGPIHPKGEFFSVSCSDGVFDQMTNKEVAAIVLQPGKPLKQKCDYIVKECLRRWKSSGGRDNVTCVIFHLQD